MRQKKQLGLWLDPATCEIISELAAGMHVNAFIEELVQQEAARRKGELIETKTLPVVREIIQQELLRAMAQLQTDLREEIRHEEAGIIAEMKARERRSDDRLASLVIRAIREGGSAAACSLPTWRKTTRNLRWKSTKMRRRRWGRILLPALMR